MAVPSPSKQELRLILKQRRQVFVSNLTSDEKDDAAARLASYAAPIIVTSLCVAGYWPLADEIDPRPLMVTLAKHDVMLALPHVTGRSSPLSFLAWRPGDQLVAGPFGLLQPAEDAPECEPDVILTPLLGYDDAGNRIGYGAGHYDRAFAANPEARRIGLAWSIQHCAALPVDDWDMAMNDVITETGIMK